VSLDHGVMDLGIFLPVSGRAAGPATLIETARKAETWGFASVWAADRVVLPWRIDTDYPYAEGSGFIVPPDRPFLECLTVLAFLAGATDRIKLGVSVVVMPFRHPLHWFRQAVSIDALSRGRLLLGVGIGWMAEEFAALGVDRTKRGRIADEQLEVIATLLREEHCTYHGEFYDFDDIAFLPKAHDDLPIWVGGEGEAAQRRAGRHGTAWFPYFVRVTPDDLAAGHANARRWAAEAGRDPDALGLNCCLPIEVTEQPVTQELDRLRGTPEQLVEALLRFGDVGVGHVGLQFMVPRYPARMEQIQRFAEQALPHLG
jgi:probable F420-dependent oxidoreductase